MQVVVIILIPSTLICLIYRTCVKSSKSTLPVRNDIVASNLTMYTVNTSNEDEPIPEEVIHASLISSGIPAEVLAESMQQSIKNEGKRKNTEING